MESVLLSVLPLYFLDNSMPKTGVMDTFWKAGATCFTTVVIVVNFKVSDSQSHGMCVCVCLASGAAVTARAASFMTHEPSLSPVHLCMLLSMYHDPYYLIDKWTDREMERQIEVLTDSSLLLITSRMVSSFLSFASVPLYPVDIFIPIKMDAVALRSDSVLDIELVRYSILHLFIHLAGLQLVPFDERPGCQRILLALCLLPRLPRHRQGCLHCCLEAHFRLRSPAHYSRG